MTEMALSALTTPTPALKKLVSDRLAAYGVKAGSYDLGHDLLVAIGVHIAKAPRPKPEG